MGTLGVVVVEDLARDGDDTGPLGQRLAEGQRVVPAVTGHVGDDEVGALRYVQVDVQLRQSVAEQVTLALQGISQPAREVELVGERVGRGRLIGRARGVGEPVLRAFDGGDQLRRTTRPADLPARERERLAHAGDRQGPLGHARQGRQRHVLAPREDEVLVHLVGDHDEVVLDRDSCDPLQLGSGEHGAGRVVG